MKQFTQNIWVAYDVLGIDDHSRFINLLTVLRSHKKEFSKNGPNKRCQGARDTFDFGTTLVQANSSLCGEKGSLVTDNSAARQERDKINKLLDEIETAKVGELTEDTVDRLMQRRNVFGVKAAKKYIRNK